MAGCVPSGSEVGHESFKDNETRRITREFGGRAVEYGPYVEELADGGVKHYPNRIGIYVRETGDL